MSLIYQERTSLECDLSRKNILGFIYMTEKTPFSLAGNVNKGIYFYQTADELSHYKLNNFPLKAVSLLVYAFSFLCGSGGGGGRGGGGIHHSSTNKIQYDNLTSMQQPSDYNHLVYHVSPAILYEQFLKLLNVHKACSDLGKGTALSRQLY